MITILFLVVFMLIFGGRLIEAAVAEARPERRPTLRRGADEDLPVDGRLPGRPGAHLPHQRRPHHDFLAITAFPSSSRSAFCPGSPAWCPTPGPSCGPRHLPHRPLYRGDMARNRRRHLFHRVRPDQKETSSGRSSSDERSTSPLVVTLSILFFGEVAGIVGAIAAVPVVATCRSYPRAAALRRQQLALDAGAHRKAHSKTHQGPAGIAQALGVPCCERRIR